MWGQGPFYYRYPHRNLNLSNTIKPLIYAHLSRQLTCWSLRCSWSITCRCCANYILILDLTSDFNGFDITYAGGFDGIFCWIKFWSSDSYDCLWMSRLHNYCVTIVQRCLHKDTYGCKMYMHGMSYMVAFGMGPGTVSVMLNTTLIILIMFIRQIYLYRL